MKFTVLTLFPELIRPWVSEALLGKAAERGILDFEIINLRDFSNDKHHKVDGPPYGGGAGMVIRVDVVSRALSALSSQGGAPDEIILLTPAGEPFKQATAEALSKKRHLVLLCGRYEGFDARVEGLVTREISVGDFVMMGGEAAVICLLEAIGRLVEGTLGDAESHLQDSFSSRILDYPEYTRPPVWEGSEVPAILQNGNHALIATWRRKQAIKRTLERRPDLLSQGNLQPQDSATLLECGVDPSQLVVWGLPDPPKSKKNKRVRKSVVLDEL